MKNVLSIYGGHDSSFTFVDKNNKLRIFEYERFLKKRYASFTEKFECEGNTESERKKFLELIKNNTSKDIDLIVYNNLFDNDFDLIRQYFPNANFELMGHHMSHAFSGFFTSNFEDAIILSADGGGHDYGMVSFTNVYLGSNNTITLLESKNMNLGVAYGRIGGPISEIGHGGGDQLDSMAYAGKVMGLCAYGEINYNWVPHFEEYFQGIQNSDNQSNLDYLSVKLNLNLRYNSLSGKLSYDFAATAQYVFENVMLKILEPYIDQCNNFIIVGGCGLNVLFNQKLKKILNKINKNLYIPPFPNDCGLSLGQFLQKTKTKINNFVYSGINILDYDNLENYKKIYNPIKVDISQVVDLLKLGKIIGVIDGLSEVGPRALGNRSIICDPTVKNMKDVLNSKVKFREWFRPFAPVCRDEDSKIFFDDVFESEFMSYAPIVKEQYRDVLPSITHNDGTGRLQTVSKYGHKLFYNILTELKNRNEIPVILNTSFNIKGKPILTSIQDSLFVLEETDLDYVLIENYLFEKLKK